jgi:hypothetical protein
MNRGRIWGQVRCFGHGATSQEVVFALAGGEAAVPARSDGYAQILSQVGGPIVSQVVCSHGMPEKEKASALKG